jgi:hypothetical protein
LLAIQRKHILICDQAVDMRRHAFHKFLPSKRRQLNLCHHSLRVPVLSLPERPMAPAAPPALRIVGGPQQIRARLGSRWSAGARCSALGGRVPRHVFSCAPKGLRCSRQWCGHAQRRARRRASRRAGGHLAQRAVKRVVEAHDGRASDWHLRHIPRWRRHRHQEEASCRKFVACPDRNSSKWSLRSAPTSGAMRGLWALHSVVGVVAD